MAPSCHLFGMPCTQGHPNFANRSVTQMAANNILETRQARMGSRSLLAPMLLLAFCQRGQADCDNELVVGTNSALHCLNPCASGCQISLPSPHPDATLAAAGWTYEVCSCTGGTEDVCCHLIKVYDPGGAPSPGTNGSCKPQVGCPGGTCLLDVYIAGSTTHYYAQCF